MNAWGFFENVSRLSQDMVSFLSSVVLQLQAALAARIESTTVANVTFDLPHQPVLQDAVSQPFALMFSGPSPSHATLAPRAQRQLIDEFFACHSRRVVLMAAPISLMIEAALRCAHGQAACCCAGPTQFLVLCQIEEGMSPCCEYTRQVRAWLQAARTATG